jgi:uncharacterized phiE125 gp8 family phage protein
MKINGIYNGDITRTPHAGSDEQPTEPVTVQEFKDWAKISVTDDDDLIEALLPASRLRCEQYLNMSLIPTTIEATILCQLGNYALPYGPITSITSLNETDEDATAITDYTVLGSSFKSLSCQYCNPLRIVYEAGYDECPNNIKKAILQDALYLYDNRGDEAIANNLAPMAIAILAPIRRVV